MNTNIFILTPDEAAKLAEDITPQPPPVMSCTPAAGFCVAWLFAALLHYVAAIINWALAVNAAAIAFIWCEGGGIKCPWE